MYVSMLQLPLKRLKMRSYSYGLIAAVIIALSVALRIVLVALGWPETNSDEGTFGVEAMHIAFNGAHPIYMYGQNYMGVIESYVGAALFRLFGVSLFNLRLGMILLYALFLIAMYFLTSLLFTKKLALVTLFLLAVGCRPVFMVELTAVGGVIEILFFGALLMLLASWLALTYDRDATSAGRWRRYIVYGIWGLAAGLGLYSHMLILPFIAMSALILLVFCHRELRTWAIFWLIAGFLIGAIPLIDYNLKAPLDQNSLAVLLELHRVDATAPNAPHGFVLYAKQILGTFWYSLPIATNLSPVCALTSLPHFGPSGTGNWGCVAIQGTWSLAYMALLFIAIFIAGRAVWTQWRAHRVTRSPWTTEERRQAILEFARLMLLLTAVITIFSYVSSPVSAVRPWSTRYLAGLLIAIPAMLWPLWHGLRAEPVRQLTSRFARYGLALRSSLLALIGVIFLAGTIAIFPLIPSIQAQHQQDNALTHDLMQAGITHFYSDYWTCDRLIFLTQEHLICGVVQDNSPDAPGLNRYGAYYNIVKADPHSAYVLLASSTLASTFSHLIATTGAAYTQYTMDGYIVYVPSP